ncbi:unnamed protein product, partial [Diplocarpon coronariae]
MFSCGGRADG